MQTLSRKEACNELGISMKTLQRRMNNGTYKFTKLGGGQYAEVRFTYSDLGLPEPPAPPIAAEPEPEPPASAPAPTAPPPAPEMELSDVEKRIIADLRFAERYRKGQATDSSGNKVDGTNVRFPSKGSQSLLGPVERTEPRPPRSGTSHMNPALLSDWPDPTGAEPLIKPGGPQTGMGFTRSGSSLAAGYTQEQYDADMKTWRRSGGGLSEGQKMQLQHKAAINAAFPRPE